MKTFKTWCLTEKAGVLFAFIHLLLLCHCTDSSQEYYTHQWAVHVKGGRDIADKVANDHGFINKGEIIHDSDLYYFIHNNIAKRSLLLHSGYENNLSVDTRVHWAEQQKAKKRFKRNIKVEFSDPRWPDMWYLNRGNGLDMNVMPAWSEGLSGKGVVVSILDDGIEKDHPDLAPNYDQQASYDVNDDDLDPSPRYDVYNTNQHGTRGAGVIAAKSNNSVCSVGVAPGVSIGGIRMLDGDVTDIVEARSLSFKPQHIDIYCVAWGPDDDGSTVGGPGELANLAFVEGVTKGRGGKGSIYVWSSGNGGRRQDNCNCDGYANSIYTLSVSSVTEHGNVPWYSEACSSILASTYSSGSGDEREIVTTDLRHSCTSNHTGTSASASLATGILALTLETNPNLTWRDIQHLVVLTARPVHLTSPDWRVNGVGRRMSHKFGYGLMDAHGMVKLARKWETVPKQHHCRFSVPDEDKEIPGKSSVIFWSLPVANTSECQKVKVLEHVQIKLTISSHRRGDLRILLTSPMGTQSTLLTYRKYDRSTESFVNWPFMTVHFWGETPFGIWKLEIHNNHTQPAKLKNWELNLYGTEKHPFYSKSSAICNSYKHSIGYLMFLLITINVFYKNLI